MYPDAGDRRTRGSLRPQLCGMLVVMQVTFVRGRDGAPYAMISGSWRGFNEALGDAVGSLPPRGSMEKSVSTYWIDRAEQVMRQMLERGESGVIQGGNSTTLLLRDGKVVARSDYELFDEEQMDPVDFSHVLAEWRAEIIRVRDGEAPVIAETYRRNPYAEERPSG